MTRNRRGFTLIEILVVTVLGALVVGAALQVLITNRRAYTAQTATISGQQSTRMAVEVLFAELREVSASGGDIIAMSSDSIRVRLMRKFSIVCATDFTITDPTLTVLDTLRTASGLVLQAGANRFEGGDSVFIWADNDPDIDTDDVWLSAEIDDTDTTATCPQDGAGATELEFSSLLAMFLADSVGIGAPIRSYQYFTFGTTTMNGDVYLARRSGTGAMVPVTGPLQPSSGLDFAFMDSLGAATTTPADVNQIRVTVRTGSTVLGPLGQMVQDSISVLIFTRG
ncbi:MAG: prepilin-type N-terminal cleavage/methylation domain-containing protein [Gemmatimonadetes bacterium]|nr:prepilin-type N-terminal cleavage/methylation domain-containing protein [Gemmatimonadota bacterium]NNF14293.1 prepilin-type N-terminal cleavage/methylation domain-containing protein [Gemmatimonadota bacterium]NNL29661.1 prepilin-type N-terminal cleavage/methylation domain-containing protein [Gemmatimonadota bacterium]